MSDEQENVEAGSETSGEPAAETTTTEQSVEETTSTDAGAAADETATSSETSGEPANADESRTSFAEDGLRAGDECICPDGRKGTVHSFDAGLICIPNAEQGK